MENKTKRVTFLNAFGSNHGAFQKDHSYVLPVEIADDVIKAGHAVAGKAEQEKTQEKTNDLLKEVVEAVKEEKSEKPKTKKSKGE